VGGGGGGGGGGVLRPGVTGHGGIVMNTTNNKCSQSKDVQIFRMTAWHDIAAQCNVQTKHAAARF